MKKILGVVLTLNLLAATGLSYGPRGHGLVGAIADRRVAHNATLKAKIAQLLDGLTLQRVATIPDEIKGLDHNPNGFHLPGHASLETQLRAFVTDNASSAHPSHHEFHYTDVPVFGNEQYSPGDIGRSEFDIVHMIPFCIRVLRGDEPENNSRAITKPVALILLVHYLGDIHQPLHVGAEYFDAQGNPFEPLASSPGFADQGGNKLTLFTLIAGKSKSMGKFHSYWDSQTVNNAFGSSADSTVAKKLAANEPVNWKLTGPVDSWAEQMANEIIPTAREAHTRLEFSNVKITPGSAPGSDIKSGRIMEKKQAGVKLYTKWAAATVKEEIHKGGWRLAALLEEILQ
ncbi:MAG: S1/P1 nuclease [Pyrinomonadaceae bacterium]